MDTFNSNRECIIDNIDIDMIDNFEGEDLDDLLGNQKPPNTITSSPPDNQPKQQKQHPQQQQQQPILQEDIHKMQDPLEAVENLEMQLTSLDKKTQEYYECEYPQIFGSSYAHLQQNQIKTINFSTIDYIKLKQEKTKRKITCLHVLPDGEVYLGTGKGEVLRYAKKEDYPLILFMNGQISPVKCMDTRDQLIGIGYYDGSINIFNQKKVQLLITINDIHTSEVFFIKFFHDIFSADPFHENPADKLTDITFLSCDKGELMRTTFTKGLFSGFKPSTDNFPDLYEYVEIVKRSQRAGNDEIRIKSGENTIFSCVMCHKHVSVVVENITVFLQAFVTKDAIIILAECKQAKPMIVLYEKRSHERYRDVDIDQMPVIDFQKDVFCIGWGTIVYVVKLQLQFAKLNNNEIVIKNLFPLKSRFYINQTPILYCNFIRKSIIFLVDNTNTCHIINLLKFAKHPYKYNENSEQSMNSHVFQSHNILQIAKSRLLKIDNIQFKSYYSSIQIVGEKIYILSIQNPSTESQKINQIFDESQILEGQILEWEYQLNSKFESKKDVNSQFQTLEICLQIYQGKNESFGEISTFKKEISIYICKKVKESFERYLVDLVNFNIKKSLQKRSVISDLSEQQVKVLSELKDDIFDIVKYNNIMMQYMKYLILTENLHFMYTEFLDMFKSVPSLKLIFYASLSPYIALEYIKFIPNEAFSQQYEFISKLIFNLDPTLQKDYSYIKRLCNKRELLSPFIYISTRIENNFKAPLQQMISDFKSFDKYSDKRAADQVVQPQYTKEWIGYKLLWYIRRSLYGLVYPNQQMDENLWLEASTAIFEWIFLDRQLTNILNIDPDLGLQNLLMFFRGYSCDLLKQKEEEYKIKLSKILQLQVETPSDQKNGNENKKRQKQSDGLKTLICKFIQQTLEQDKLSQECWNYFFLLLAEVKDKDVKLDLDISTRAAVFLIENPQAHFYKNKDFIQEIEYKSRQIIKIIQPHIEKGKLDLKDFLQKALNSPFVEVCSYIFRLQDDFDSAIKIYLDASIIDIRFKVFSFIKEILESQPDKQAQVVEKIFLHLPKLIAINHTKTKELLENIQNYDIHAIIRALNGQDDLVFKILQEYIQEQRKKIIEDGQQIPENETYLYLYYIKLLVKFQPSEIVNELKTKLYNLDDSLKILKETDHLQGVAYIYSCIGNIQGALEIHLRVIQKYLERNNKSYAEREFKEVIEILLKQNKRGDEESENNWFFWITGVQRMEQKVPKEMIEVQKDIEQESFENLIHNVQIKSILQNKDLLPVLGQNSSEGTNINHKLYDTLQTLLKSYTFEQKIFEYSKDILYNEYCRRENISFKYAKKGIKFNFACSQCKKELGRDITHFYCSHTFCNDCARNYCQVCFEKKKNSCKNALDQEEWKNLVQKHDKYLKEQQKKQEQKELEESKQNQENIDINKIKKEEMKKAQEKKLILDRKLKKLKNFDRNVQDSRMENLNFNNF